MTTPASMSELSTTAASNNPSGSDAPSTLDDQIRALAAIVRQNVTKGTDIASASSITIPASGNYFVVTGTTGITGISDTNSWYGREVVLKFSGALTITHSSSLILPGATNIITGAGDVLGFVSESSGVWRCSSINSRIKRFIKGSNIASAATVDLGTATGNTVDVTHSTGTTAITSLGGASLQAGTEIETRFVITGGTLSLTHHATNLYLAGGANIKLANGDVIRWRKMHSSNAEWKMVGGKLPASQAEAEAGTDNGRDMTPLRVAQAIAVLGGGKVKQIVFANKTDTFSTASTSFTDLTGMSVSLTPTSASSKVALFAMVNVGGNAALFAFFKFLRDSTDILIGNTAGSRLRVNSVSTPAGLGQMMPATLLAIDSPGDTSAHTYKVQMAVGSGTGYVNRSGTDSDSATWPRAASMIIAMEYRP